MLRILSAVLSFLLTLTFTVAYTNLSDTSLQSLPSPGTDFDIYNGALLSPILQVRVPGTPGAESVRQHFVDFFSKNLPDWKIGLQNSTQHTALGGSPITFVNVIATRDPPWSQEGHVGRLSLAAHYDSKYTPTGFIGATDSAAPCAILLHAARSLDAALTRKWQAMEESGDADSGLEPGKGVQILLLDGEEAFISWTHTDSLYGARALAQDWDSEFNPAMSTYRNKINEIDLFLLLDLLGAKSPRVPSYFRTTHWAYKNMALLEKRLRELDLMQSKPSTPFLTEENKDSNQLYIGMIEDDHIPFMARGVEVLHIIPSPFPSVWHRIEDDGEHLDMPTVEDWAKLTTAFAAAWMDLEGYLTVKMAGNDEREAIVGHEASEKGRRKEGAVEQDKL